MGDKPLKSPTILNTEEDVAEKFWVCCAECGTYLDLIGIEDNEERGITLAISKCETCSGKSYQEGYGSATSKNWGTGRGWSD